MAVVTGAAKQMICFNYRDNGSCDFKENCRFSHSDSGGGAGAAQSGSGAGAAPDGSQYFIIEDTGGGFVFVATDNVDVSTYTSITVKFYYRLGNTNWELARRPRYVLCPSPAP